MSIYKTPFRSLIYLCIIPGLIGLFSQAEAADPQGVRIIIDKPADNTIVSVGDSIVVRVQFLSGTAALDSVNVRIVNVPEGVSESFSGSSFNEEFQAITSVAAIDSASSTPKFSKGVNSADASSADSDGFQTYRFSFIIEEGDCIYSEITREK